MFGWRRANLALDPGSNDHYGIYPTNPFGPQPFGVRIEPEMDAACFAKDEFARSIRQAVGTLHGQVAKISMGDGKTLTVNPADWILASYDHEAPDPKCRCGFYALKQREDMKEHWYGGNATLEVELSGIIIEATNGFRAQHQRVLSCRIEPECCFCGGRAVALLPGGQLGYLMNGHTFSYPAPVCSDCGKTRQCLTLADLVPMLGVEVRWDDKPI